MNEGLLVVKIGGATDIDLMSTCQDVAELITQGYGLVLVHGGSERANHLSTELGHPPRFLRSPSGYVSRYTDKQTRDIYVRAVSELNSEIVQMLRFWGVDAAGLVHREQCVLRGERKKALRAVMDGRVRVIRDDYSGQVNSVDGMRLRLMLEEGITPVVPPMALSEVDGFLNVDGDRAAAVIAGVLDAHQLILLSNVPGLMQEYPKESSLVSFVPREGFDRALVWAQGRMKRKVLSAREALEQGVTNVVLADGRLQLPLQQALGGGGTRFG
jgi:acetylglutamate/LysW-gamma-L-alpha-aminoadipate kinase